MTLPNYSVFKCADNQPSIDWDKLLPLIQKAFETGKLALIVGSGVSQIAPANVPAGENIVKYLMERLFLTYPYELRDLSERIKRSIDGIPFEVLMARMSELDAELAREIVLLLTHIEQSNILHLQIRRLMDAASERGFTFHVVTSNYDMGISNIQCNSESIPPIHHSPNLVITENQINQTGSEGEIFHIHGANTTLTSLVFDYKQEFKLEQWKRKHLQAIMQNKLILVLGFSGKDLDICRVLVNCNPQGVIWFRTSEESCQPETWTIDAQNLVKRIPFSYAVNTSSKLQYALAELLHDDVTNLVNLEVDMKAIQARFDKIQSTYPVQLQLWARWMGLRAGFWQLAERLTEEEQALLSEQQVLEIKAFGLYYSGQHLSGAILLREAGGKAIQNEKPAKKLERYLYFCNTEVEYLNRGAFTLKAFRATLRVSLTILWRTIIHHNKMTPEAWDEFKNLLGSLATMWPLLPLLISSDMLGAWPSKIIRPILRWILRPVEGADLDKFITILATMSTPDSPAFREVQEQYRWLGQQARRINLYRLSALRQLQAFYIRPDRESKTNLERLKEIYAMVDLAIHWAQDIGDPCRTAKSKLVCLEVLKAIAVYNPEISFIDSLPNEARIRSSDGSIVITSTDAWDELLTGEVSAWCWRPVRTLYKFMERGHRTLHRRIRLFILSFLETS
nr:hypothetical protein [Ktedonobacteraceae bacterium]